MGARKVTELINKSQKALDEISNYDKSSSAIPNSSIPVLIQIHCIPNSSIDKRAANNYIHENKHCTALNALSEDTLHYCYPLSLGLC